MIIEVVCDGERVNLDAVSITDRERDVLEQMVQHDRMSTKSIAQALVVSERTVQTHLLNLFRKFGVNNRTSLYRAYTCYRQRLNG